MLKPIVCHSAAWIYRLRRCLPLPAHGREGLVERLKRDRPEVTKASRLYVTEVYDGGAAGLMCAIKFDLDALTVPALVVPLSQIAVDRRHPISKEISSYRRGSAKRP